MTIAEPLELLLPGIWRFSFVDEVSNTTGEGEYTFKLAGTFNAAVQDWYSGAVTWHGYWQVESARLVLVAQEMDAFCSSCLGAGNGHRWTVELEQVTDATVLGIVRRDDDDTGVLGRFDKVG